MFRLEYINRNTTNEWEFIGDFDEEKDMNKNIADFFTKHEYKSYYQRHWVDEDGWNMIDFGSHSQFYRYKELKS